MKKVWLFATAALMIGTSCSNDENVGGIDDSTKQEIVIGTGAVVSAEKAMASRGIGAIGGLEAENKWNGETVYVYGINTSAEGDAQFAINAQAATAPKDAATGALTWATPNTHYYYNGNDVYDFYGVHIDDAVADAATAMKIAAGADLTQGFAVQATIDGTQDLMVAVPNKTEDITAAGNAELTGNENSLYSAWSSRRGAKPNLVFTHLLSRLNFQAKCGSNPIPGTGQDAKDAIKITKIEVLDVFNKGTLTIIPADGAAQGFATDAKVEDAKVNFTVKSRGTTGALEELQAVSVISADLVTVGEDLLLYPEQKFDVNVYVEQDKDENGTIEDNEKSILGKPIVLADGKAFEAGSMYNINITVYGLERIEVNATLTPWKEGGDINIGSDEIPVPTPVP